MPVGRPTKYNEEMLERARLLYEMGATDKEAAKKLGIDRSNLSEWKVKHKVFRDTIKKAKDKYDTDLVEGALRSRAIGGNFGDKHYAPDPTSMIFWLKNRNPNRWRDKIDHEHEHSGKVSILVGDADTAEALKNALDEGKDD